MQAPCSFFMFTIREQSQPGSEEVGGEHRCSRQPAVLASDPKPRHTWGRLAPYTALKVPILPFTDLTLKRRSFQIPTEHEGHITDTVANATSR